MVEHHTNCAQRLDPLVSNRAGQVMQAYNFAKARLHCLIRACPRSTTRPAPPEKPSVRSDFLLKIARCRDIGVMLWTEIRWLPEAILVLLAAFTWRICRWVSDL